MSSTLEVIDSYLSLDSTQYAQAPIGATRIATLGDGVDLYGVIPTWTVTNYEIEFDIVFPTAPVNMFRNIFSSDGVVTTKDLMIASSGNFTYTTHPGNVYLDGVNISANLTTTPYPLDGAVHHMKITSTGTIAFKNVLTKSAADGNFGTVSIFNLRLTDLDNSANSRFYPMDEAYPTYTTTRQLFASDTLTVVTPSSIVVETGWVNEGGGVYYRPFSLEGDAIRFELPYPTGKTYLVTFDLEKEAGGEVKLVSDGTVRVSGNSGSYAVLITPTEHSGATGIRFARNNGTTGWGGRVKNIVFKEVANAGLWYNRAAGNVVTVYPEAIKPSEEFFVAVKYECTDNTPNSGFNYSWGMRNAASTARMVAYNPESNNRFGMQVYNSANVKVKEHFGIPTPLRTTQADGVHTLVYHVRPGNRLDIYWDGGSVEDDGAWGASDQVLQYINLNGSPVSIGTSSSRPASNFHYFYIYNTLSAADINALMQGEHPASVGNVRQGYNLAGDGDEVNGGTALTLYGAPEFFVPAGTPLSSPLSFPLSFDISRPLTF